MIEDFKNIPSILNNNPISIMPSFLMIFINEKWFIDYVDNVSCRHLNGYKLSDLSYYFNNLDVSLPDLQDLMLLMNILKEIGGDSIVFHGDGRWHIYDVLGAHIFGYSNLFDSIFIRNKSCCHKSMELFVEFLYQKEPEETY